MRRACALLSRVMRSQNLTLAIVALATVAVGFGVVLLLGSKPTSLVGTCPVVSPTHYAVVVERLSTTHNDYTQHNGSLAVFDMATGARLGVTDVGSWQNDDHRAVCFGKAGEGQVWLRPAGPTPTVQVRAVATGAVVTPFSAFLEATPALSVGVTGLGWDPERAAPTLSTADGRSLLLDAATRGTTRYEGQVTMTPLGVQADTPIHSASVPYYAGGMPELLLADGRRVTLEGHPRSVMLVDGSPLLGDRDFLSPAVLIDPASGSIEWSSPPSLVVVEETLVNSLQYRITRIGLDGREIFTFDPGEPLPATLRYRPTPWTASPDGRLLLHFGGLGVIAIDAATGVERYRMGYDGKPMDRPS